MSCLWRVYFAKHSRPEVLLRQLENYRQLAQEGYKWCLELEKTYVTDKTPLQSSDHAYMTISHGIYTWKAIIAWCDDMLERLKHKETP